MPHPQAEPARYRRSSGPGLMRSRSMGSAHRITASARSSVGAFTKGNLGDSNTAPVRMDESQDWNGALAYVPVHVRSAARRSQPVKPARKLGPLDQREPSRPLTRRGIPTTRDVYVPRAYVNAVCSLDD